MQRQAVEGVHSEARGGAHAGGILNVGLRVEPGKEPFDALTHAAYGTAPEDAGGIERGVLQLAKGWG